MNTLLCKIQSCSPSEWKEAKNSMEQVSSKLEQQFFSHFPNFDVLEMHWFSKSQQEKTVFLQNLLCQVCFLEGSHQQWFGMTPQDWYLTTASSIETSCIFIFCKEILLLLQLSKNESELRQSILTHGKKQHLSFELMQLLKKKISSQSSEWFDLLFETLFPLQSIYEWIFLLLFAITLQQLDIVCKSKLPNLYSLLNEEQKMENANLLQEIKSIKQKGNKLFHKELYKEAIQEYAMALLLITREKLTIKEFVVEKAVLFANRATCFLKLEQFDKVIQECSASLALQPKQAKTLFRRAYSYEQVKQFSSALQDYYTAKKLLEEEEVEEEEATKNEAKEIELGIQRCQANL